MQSGKKNIKSKVITVDDYYSERFLRLEIEQKYLRELMIKGFEETNRRFTEMKEETNRRFDENREDMNRRFNESDRRFDALTTRIDRFMIWSFGITITSTGLIIAAMKFWK